ETPQLINKQVETKTSNKVLIIQRKITNEELIQLYLLALNQKTEEEKSDPKKPSHKVRNILLEYFQGEGQAIHYLEKVSHRALVRLTLHQRQILLAAKVPDDPFIRGPNFKWTDDMWWYIYEMCQSFDSYALPGIISPKRG